MLGPATFAKSQSFSVTPVTGAPARP